MIMLLKMTKSSLPVNGLSQSWLQSIAEGKEFSTVIKKCWRSIDLLYPSIDSLLTKIDSKYSLVSVAAKRARVMQLQNNAQLEKYVSHKSVGKALEEIH